MNAVNRFCGPLSLAACLAVLAGGCGKPEPTATPPANTPKAVAAKPKPTADKEPPADTARTDPPKVTAASPDNPKPAPTKPAPPKPAEPKAPESLAKAKPDVVLTAAELEAEGKKEINFLFTKHAGKVVEVGGVVAYRGRTYSDYVLRLISGTGRADTVGCPVSEKDWKSILDGQTAVLRMWVNPAGVSSTWTLVAATGPTPPTLTTVEWAKAWADDPNGAAAKYEKKRVIVTGVIESVKVLDPKLNHAEVTLVAGPGKPLVCKFSGMWLGEAARNKAFKPGQKLKVIGECTFSGQLEECEDLEVTP